MSQAAALNMANRIHQAEKTTSPPKKDLSFSNIIGHQFAQVAEQGKIIETSLHQAVMGNGGLEHIAQDFSEFTVQVEAIKNIVDAGIAAIKQIVNTPI